MFQFGEAESGGDAIAPGAEDETACDGDGDGSSGDGDVDVDGTTSGGNVDLIQVEVAQLAGESQHVCYSRRTQTEDLLVLPVPPIHHAERPYRPARHQRQRGRLKIKSINVSQTGKVEMTHQICTCTMQPHGNTSRHCLEVYRPKHQHGCIKIGPINVSSTRNSGKPTLNALMRCG